MTITGLITGILITFFIVFTLLKWESTGQLQRKHAIIIGIVCCALLWGGMVFYYNRTASGQRAVVDQHSELVNGLDRTINIYTANGDLIATYSGKIDLEDNDGGYVIFD